MDAYIITGLILAPFIIFLVWAIASIFKQIPSKNKRTKFVINIKNKNYEYYENKIEEWLKYNKFKKYSKKRKGRILKYIVNDVIYRYGFNYYRQDDKIIIEVWRKDINYECQLYQEDIYLDLLKSLMKIENEISDINYVELLDEIDYSKIVNQKLEKKKTRKTIFTILAISLGITLILLVLNYFISGYYNKPKYKKESYNEALRIINEVHPNFKLTESSFDVWGGKSNSVNNYRFGNITHNKKDDYYAVYLFYGTMDTPEKKNDRVIIFMSNSDNSPYKALKNGYNWSGMIVENKENFKKWDFYLR